MITDARVEAAAKAALHKWNALTDDMRQYWRPRFRAALAAAQAGDAGEPSVYETPDLHGRAGAIRKDGLAEGSPADPFIRGAFHDESIRRSGFAAGIEAAANDIDRCGTAEGSKRTADRIRALRPPAEPAESERLTEICVAIVDVWSQGPEAIIEAIAPFIDFPAKPIPPEPTDAMIAAGIAAALAYVARAKDDQTLVEARGPIVSAVYKAMVAAAEKTK